MNIPITKYDLCTLHACRGINTIRYFCESIQQLDATKLAQAYRDLRDEDISRKQAGKRYFVEHSGAPTNNSLTTLKPWDSEDHLAMALSTDSAMLQVVTGDFKALQVLAYKFPLYSAHSGPGLRAADLFAAVDGTAPCVIELKKTRKSKNSTQSSADSPLYALLQGLKYCAVVERNMPDIADESKRLPMPTLKLTPLHLMVMAPSDYWSHFIDHLETGNWQLELKQLAVALTNELGIKIHFIALHGAEFKSTEVGKGPHLLREVRVKDAF